MRGILTASQFAAFLLFGITIATAQPELSPTELSLNPGEIGLPERTALEVQAAIAGSDWRHAEAVLFDEAMRSPDNEGLQRALGIAHFQAGHYLAAATALKRADAVRPLDSEARFLLASTFLRLRRGHWARPELERLVESQNRRPRYGLALARLHYEAQRFQEGANQLLAALEQWPALAEARDLLGQCLEGLGAVDAALDEYQSAIALNEMAGKRSHWPHYHRGSLLHDLGKLGPAREALLEAAKAEPNHASTLLELGIVLTKEGELDHARATLEAARKLSPGEPRVHYALAGVYRRLDLGGLANAATGRFLALTKGLR